MVKIHRAGWMALRVAITCAGQGTQVAVRSSAGVTTSVDDKSRKKLNLRLKASNCFPVTGSRAARPNRVEGHCRG